MISKQLYEKPFSSASERGSRPFFALSDQIEEIFYARSPFHARQDLTIMGWLE
jgi:hypothetical protein